MGSSRRRSRGAALEVGRVERSPGTVTCAHCHGLHELAGSGPRGDAIAFEYH